jgi:undecaprenyl-diphosphatase
VLTAALLGVIQGLTEFVPVSSTAHLLIGARLFRFSDPGGVFTVLIQLGSILAVMWLYRAKIARVLRGLPSDPDSRHFVLMILVAFLPAAVAGALLSVREARALHDSSVIAASFIVGDRDAGRRALPAAPVIVDADRTPLSRALGIGLCRCLH